MKSTKQLILVFGLANTLFSFTAYADLATHLIVKKRAPAANAALAQPDIFAQAPTIAVNDKKLSDSKMPSLKFSPK